MPDRAARLGDVTDDYCPRCRLLMNHDIASLNGESVAKVTCRTCYNTHDYRNAEVPAKRKSKKSEDPKSLMDQVLAGMGRPPETPPVPVVPVRKRRDLWAERTPRPSTKVGRCPRQRARLTLADATEHHRQLPGSEHEQERQRGRPEPRPDGCAQERRHVRAGEDAADHGERQLHRTPARIGDRSGVGRVVVDVQQHIAKPAADHCPWNDRNGDEQQVVRPQAVVARDQPGGNESRGDDRN